MTPIPGHDAEEQARHVAGALAEHGVQKLLLVHADQQTVLPARQTDLPGLLRTAPVGSRLECEPLGLVIEVTAHGLVWRWADEAARDRFTPRK